MKALAKSLAGLMYRGLDGLSHSVKYKLGISKLAITKLDKSNVDNYCVRHRLNGAG
jgi:hypothetical protein